MKSILFLLFITTTLVANQSFYIDQALEKGLDKDSYWLKLLHFENNKSTIKTKNFFLSSDGYRDAKSELIQTIEIFESNPNMICKYPARYKWLNRKLQLNIPNQNCLELENFLKPNFQKLKVIFTSQRYDSPASVFGHTMMKVESDEIPYALNYTAKIAKGTDAVSYIYKGLNGKFKSGYSFVPFSLKDYEYRSGEFRDLIEFSLNLNSDELKNMMFHFYEIKDTKEDYYFLSHNCSSELIKLVDMAKYDSDLSSELKNIVIPIDIVYILQKHNYIDSITKQKSKLKQFYEVVSKLNLDEKDILFKIVNNNYSVNRFAKDSNLSKKTKALMVFAGVRYFEIKSVKDGFTKKSLYPYMKLINLELKQKKENSFEKVIPLKKNPISNKFHKLYSGIKYNSKSLTSSIFGYRYLYRNRFDLVDEVKQNGSVELFDIAIREIKGDFSLDHLTLLNLEAMPISNLFFKESINKIRLGVKRVFLDDDLYIYFNYGVGYRYALNNYFNYLIYPKVGIYYNQKAIYLASLESSLEYSYKNRYISEFILELDRYTNGIEQDDFSLNNYIKIAPNVTINLALKHQKGDIDGDEIKFLVNYFF